MTMPTLITFAVYFVVLLGAALLLALRPDDTILGIVAEAVNAR